MQRTTRASRRSRKWYDGLIPSPEDEKEIYEELFGRNEARGARFQGWTNTILIGFVGRRDDLVIQKYPLKELIEKFEYFKWSAETSAFVRKSNNEPAMTLADAYRRASSGTFNIGEPMTLQVLEKKRIFKIMKDGRALLIANILVGDFSGMAVLTVMNDSIVGIYDRLNIADHIVMCTGTVQLRRRDISETVSLDDSKILPIEIKFRTYDARRIYLAEGPGRPLIEASLFREKGSYIPTDLWNSSEGSYEFPENVNCINICGVVSYVGYISRVEEAKYPTVSPDAKGSERVHYYCYRWIQLVDVNVKKPLCVKLYVSNLSWERQRNIVPGTAIVISNVGRQSKSCLYTSFYLESTYYTQVYINKDIVPDYLGPIPKSNREIVRKILSPAYCNKILSRNDVKWSVGGQLFLPLAYPQDLWKAYEDEIAKERSSFVGVPKLNLARREDQTVLVRGYVYRIDKVSRNSEGKLVAKLFWLSERQPTTKLYCVADGELNCRDTLIPDFETYWYPFAREIPRPSSDIGEMFATYEVNREKYAGICSPLLLPAVYADDGPRLNELPVVNGETCYIIWIANPYHKVLYSCVWRGPEPEAMESRVKEIIDSEPPSLANGKKSVENSDHSKLTGKSLPIRLSELRREDANLSYSESQLYPEEQEEKSRSNYMFILNLFNIDNDPQQTDSNVIVSLVDFFKQSTGYSQ